jgi:hypothetical protein
VPWAIGDCIPQSVPTLFKHSVPSLMAASKIGPLENVLHILYRAVL